MKYMLLIYVDPQAAPAGDTPAANAEFAAYGAYSQELAGSGAMVSGDPLHGNDTATTVRVRGGETLTSDGPFAETKEHLAGYYVVDVADLDAAIAWAAKIPSALHSAIEVRPVMELSAM
jgi:hypothetical protein